MEAVAATSPQGRADIAADRGKEIGIKIRTEKTGKGAVQRKDDVAGLGIVIAVIRTENTAVAVASIVVAVVNVGERGH